MSHTIEYRVTLHITSGPILDEQDRKVIEHRLHGVVPKEWGEIKVTVEEL